MIYKLIFEIDRTTKSNVLFLIIPNNLSESLVNFSKRIQSLALKAHYIYSKIYFYSPLSMSKI